MKAVVVLSGGQDSAICLALAVKKYGACEVCAITFTYGQRHVVETTYAKRLAKKFDIAAHKVVNFGFYKSITTNALMDSALPIRAGKVCPTTVVEGRNAFFLMTAAVWAKTLGATVLYTGVSQTDFSGYPDCRAAFIRAQEKAIRLALNYPIKIVTPFMRMNKAQEWALADKLGIFELVKNETLTCYNGVPGAGCRKCPACKLRNRGLREYENSLRRR